ncbi:MAG: hypothetical protein P0S94_04495 [Simkaniaceae bacterium]|nr:hypothetical protein [Simkaniaceae bacterium]
MKKIAVLFFALSALYANNRTAFIFDATTDLGIATVKAYDARGWSVFAGVDKVPSMPHRISNVQYVKIDPKSVSSIVASLQKVYEKDFHLDAIVITKSTQEMSSTAANFLRDERQGHLIYLLESEAEFAKYNEMATAQASELTLSNVDVSIVAPSHVVTFGKLQRVSPPTSSLPDAIAEIAPRL